LRKVTFEEYGIEEKRLWTVEYFDGCSPILAADVLTAVTGVREESVSSCASETDNFLGEAAGLLNWVEEFGWRASQFLGDLTVHADEEGSAVIGVGVPALCQVRAVEYWS
jgi:hypothetical protein